MKIQVIAALVAIVAVSMTACEQHQWSSVKQLFSHGDDHGHKDGDHAKAEHGEKAAEGQVVKKEEKH